VLPLPLSLALSPSRPLALSVPLFPSLSLSSILSLSLSLPISPSLRLADPCLMHLQGTWAGAVELVEA